MDEIAWWVPSVPAIPGRSDDVGTGNVPLVEHVTQVGAVDQLHDDGGAVVVACVEGGRCWGDSDAAAIASLRKRRGMLVLREVGAQDLIATRRDRIGSSAIHTVAIPPRASGSTSS
jgi:hypothetical protein